MQKLLTAAFALTVALVQPAAAVTFPSLTTIYVGSGVQDTTGTSATTGTAVSCSNVSAVMDSIGSGGAIPPKSSIPEIQGVDGNNAVSVELTS